MRVLVIGIIVLYLLLAFLGCWDREKTIRDAGAREIHEDNLKNARDVGAVADCGGVGMVHTRGDNHRLAGVNAHQRYGADRRAILILPSPRVQLVKLDHRKTKLIGMSTKGLWLIVPGGDDADSVISDLAHRRGEEIVAEAADDPELAEQARGQVEQVMRTFFTAISWTMEIQWSGSPAPVLVYARDRSGANAGGKLVKRHFL